MDEEYLRVLMATAEETLLTASTLPESASRNDALQMVRAYLTKIALLMNAVELGQNARASRED
jgi:hypothetical protein